MVHHYRSPLLAFCLKAPPRREDVPQTSARRARPSRLPRPEGEHRDRVKCQANAPVREAGEPSGNHDMRIRRLKLVNFRSIAEGEVVFPGHTVIIGGNSVGKSTVCEALDLLLGPDRLSRSSPIDEHDFFERRYLDVDRNPILIELEAVLTDLTEDVLTRFRLHLEYWNTATSELLDEMSSPEDVDVDGVLPALRIKFEGTYDIEEDEFRADTYFASPPVEGDARRANVSRAAKRQFGFVYLRALRTGARSLRRRRYRGLNWVVGPCSASSCRSSFRGRPAR